MKRILTAILFFLPSLPLYASTVSYSAAVKKAEPAVVNVYSQRPRHYFFSAREAISSENLRPILEQRIVLGSGVIMDERGYIITNSHVIHGENKIFVSLSDGRSAEVKVVGVDSESDLAVLKIDLNDLPVIKLGDSNVLEVGDVVLAIGNPFGLGRTVTQGIISALGRTAVGLSNIENFIQTDVPLNPGSSGGALIDTDGKLMGINAGIYSKSGGYQGVSFAIPEKAVENVLKQIIEHGKVIRGWLGIEVVSGPKKSVSVEHIVKGSPAYHYLKKGDVITTVDKKEMRTAHDFMNYIAERMPGDRVKITVLRQDVSQTLVIELQSRPANQGLWQDVEADGKRYAFPDDRF